MKCDGLLVYDPAWSDTIANSNSEGANISGITAEVSYTRRRTCLCDYGILQNSVKTAEND